MLAENNWSDNLLDIANELSSDSLSVGALELWKSDDVLLADGSLVPLAAVSESNDLSSVLADSLLSVEDVPGALLDWGGEAGLDASVLSDELGVFVDSLGADSSNDSGDGVGLVVGDPSWVSAEVGESLGSLDSESVDNDSSVDTTLDDSDTTVDSASLDGNSSVLSVSESSNRSLVGSLDGDTTEGSSLDDSDTTVDDSSSVDNTSVLSGSESSHGLGDSLSTNSDVDSSLDHSDSTDSVSSDNTGTSAGTSSDNSGGSEGSSGDDWGASEDSSGGVGSSGNNRSGSDDSSGGVSSGLNGTSSGALKSSSTSSANSDA